MLWWLALLGVLAWLVDARLRLRGGRRGVAFWLWFAGLPLGAALCFVGWEVFVPVAPLQQMGPRPEDAAWLGAGLLGGAAWLVAAVLEVPLSLVSVRLRALRGRARPPGDPYPRCRD